MAESFALQEFRRQEEEEAMFEEEEEDDQRLEEEVQNEEDMPPDAVVDSRVRQNGQKIWLKAAMLGVALGLVILGVCVWCFFEVS